jgi:type IV secretion system protein VirB9
MKPATMVFSVALALSAPAWAAQQTAAAPGDSRIRFIDYDPHNVVTIYGRIGADTLIMFDRDEQIEDISGGDTDAWSVGVTKQKNGFFIKPAATSPATNAHVVTNKRVYSIDLKLARRGQVNYLTVWYRYPEEEAKRRQAESDRKRSRDLLDAGTSGYRNESYTEQGSESTSPVAAFDDGRITYLRFAAHDPMPAAYGVDETGKEYLLNMTVADDVLQLHGVFEKIVLRRGDQVTCIFNEAYSATGVRPESGTASSAVQRVIKGANQ